MNCEKVHQLIFDYLDSNLNPETNRAVADHLSSCGACREYADAERRLEKDVSGSLSRTGDSDDVIWKRALSALPEEKQLTRRSRSRLYLWGSASLAAAAALMFLLTTQQPALESLMATDYHEYLEGQMQMTVESSQLEEVSAYFEETLGYRIEACGPLDDNIRLVGGRTCYLRNVPTALLVFHKENTPVSVFVIPTDELDTFPEAAAALHQGELSAVKNGVRVRGRQVGNRVVCAVGETDAETLDRMIESICVSS